MKRRTAILAALAAVPVVASGNLIAADNLRTLLPLVPAQLTGSQQPGTLTILINADCGLVNAVVIPGTSRILVAYTARPSGILHITEDIGARLVEVPNPNLALILLMEAVSSPAFTFPGPKQGSASMVVVGSTLNVYATSREEGDPTGPFKLMRLSMPVPAPAVAP